jgi:hypothetical protein
MDSIFQQLNDATATAARRTRLNMLDGVIAWAEAEKVKLTPAPLPETPPVLAEVAPEITPVSEPTTENSEDAA